MAPIHQTAPGGRESESKASFVLPPRFQQLRDAELLEQNQLAFPPNSLMAPASPQQPTVVPYQHSRSSSFFLFRGKQPAVAQPSNSPRMNAAPLQQDARPSSGQDQRQLAGRPMTGSSSRHASVGGDMLDARQQHSPTLSPSVHPVSPPPLHSEVRSIVQLSVAHAHKIYFSGPLVRRIERQPDGQRPPKDDGWTEVWAQLGGTTLSVWDKKEIEEASKQGKQVPPSYVNVTDSFVQVLGSVTVPATATAPAKRYTNVITLNTAGSNLMLFACPSAGALISWAAALRLAAWEKSRLEEIYTAHLIRITLNHKNYPSPLVRGCREGWVQVRVAGQTDWKRLWMVVIAGSFKSGNGEAHESANNRASAASPPVPRKKRMSNFFIRETNPTVTTANMKPMVWFYSSPKPRDRKKAVLSFCDVTQAFAVYPERPELISRSTLFKLEGTFGDENSAGAMKLREGWILVMPELGDGAAQAHASDMLVWVTTVHDAYQMYGRPSNWTWDPRDQDSLMFGYPVGPMKDQLFLDRVAAESLDPREDRTSAIRSRYLYLLLERMRALDLRPTVQVLPRKTPEETNISEPSISVGSPRLRDVGPHLPLLMFDSPSASPEKETVSSVSTTKSSVNVQEEVIRPNPTPRHTINGSAPTSAAGTTSVHPQSLYSQTSSKGPSSLAGDPAIRDSRTTSPTRQQSTPTGSPLSIGPKPMDKPDSPLNLGKPLPQLFGTALAIQNGSPPSIHSLKSVGSTKETESSTSMPPCPLLTVAEHSSPGSTLQESSGQASVSDGDRVQAQPADGDHHVSPTRANNVSQEVGKLSTISPWPDPISGARPPSPSSVSFLTSPHSVAEHSRRKSQDSSSTKSDTQFSLLTSPHSQMAENAESSRAWILSHSGSSAVTSSPFAARAPSHSVDDNQIHNEAGALYFMREYGRRYGKDVDQPQPELQQSDEPESASGAELKQHIPSPLGRDSYTTPLHRGTPVEFVDQPLTAGPVASESVSKDDPASHRSLAPRQVLGRKPSGARAPPFGRPYHGYGDGDQSSNQLIEEDESQSPDSQDSALTENMQEEPPPAANAMTDDHRAEALVALSYLELNNDEEKTMSPSVSRVEPLNVKRGVSPPSKQSQVNAPQPEVTFRSSFALSRKAAERRAKLQAQQAANYAAAHKPGRAQTRRQSRIADAWIGSSDEEEEDDDYDDDDDDDPQDTDGPGPKTLGDKTLSTVPPSQSVIRDQQTQEDEALTSIVPDEDQQGYPHSRVSRLLPQVPNSRYHEQQPQLSVPRRMGHQEQYAEGARRSNLDDGGHPRLQSDYIRPRQSMWSQVLDQGRNPPPTEQPSSRDPFVRLEQAETMTKAFTLQGLLSAGLQDKEDRSAKRQEELARESGASLINVPNKLPPPQMGLLGAITAHERERKREGGVGAVLTEREREKRLAEDRQRRFDEQQRQQMDQIQHSAMYGQQFGGYNLMMGMNPMMSMNPMLNLNAMMAGGGMNPMMTGGGMVPMMAGGGMAPMMTGQMGFPGMMPGYNPQHMFAAQQAAQAYQQAMMAFSVAGSQVGGELGGAPGNFNPAVNGMGQFDPRMSMMGIPISGPSSQAPLGMQMTGMSTFDSRLSPSVPQANASGGGMVEQDPTANAPIAGRNQGPVGSGSSSPVGRPSPYIRHAEINDNNKSSPRPATPKP